MTLFHAVVCTDHESAEVLQFTAARVITITVHARSHATRLHGAVARSDYVFFGQVCDALEGITDVLVTGPQPVTAAFREHAEKYRPRTAARIAAYEGVDAASERQLVALASRHSLTRASAAPAAAAIGP
jgi:hypothetical protein